MAVRVTGAPKTAGLGAGANVVVLAVRAPAAPASFVDQTALWLPRRARRLQPPAGPLPADRRLLNPAHRPAGLQLHSGPPRLDPRHRLALLLHLQCAFHHPHHAIASQQTRPAHSRGCLRLDWRFHLPRASFRRAPGPLPPFSVPGIGPVAAYPDSLNLLKTPHFDRRRAESSPPLLALHPSSCCPRPTPFRLAAAPACTAPPPPPPQHRGAPAPAPADSAPTGSRPPTAPGYSRPKSTPCRRAAAATLCCVPAAMATTESSSATATHSGRTLVSPTPS